MEKPIIRIERMIMGYKSIVLPLNYIGLAEQCRCQQTTLCYGSFCDSFEARIRKTFFAETPQLKLCNWSEATRTLILQFWRLLFCQLNYRPITAIRRLALVFIVPCVTLSNSDLQRLIGVHPLVVFNVVAPQNHPERLKFL